MLQDSDSSPEPTCCRCEFLQKTKTWFSQTAEQHPLEPAEKSLLHSQMRELRHWFSMVDPISPRLESVQVCCSRGLNHPTQH